MAVDPSLSNELASILAALPSRQLVEIMRRAAVSNMEAECRGHLGDVPLPNLLASLFQGLAGDKIAEVAHEVSLCAIRNRCWGQLSSGSVHREIQVRCSNEAAMLQLQKREGPAIVALWHHGAPGMAPLGLQHIGVPSLIVSTPGPIAWFRKNLSSEMKIVVTGNSRLGALALKEALDRLRGGGVVVMAADGGDGKKDIPLPFLGRQMMFTRGMAVLLRLTGAPILPALATWGNCDWTFDFHLFDPVTMPPVGSMEPDAWEREVVAATVRRFEEVVRATPGQCRLDILGQLSRAPMV